MREVLYEECAEPRNMKFQKTIYIIYSVLFWLMIVVGAFFALTIIFLVFDIGILVFMVLSFISAFLFWFFRNKIYYCVDYIFVTGSTRIVKVINYKRRKKMLIFEADEVETVGKIGSETFDKIYSTPNVKKIFATPNRYTENGYYVYLTQAGVRYLVLMECKEEYLQHLVAFTGKGVVEKDYV